MTVRPPEHWILTLIKTFRKNSNIEWVLLIKPTIGVIAILLFLLLQ